MSDLTVQVTLGAIPEKIAQSPQAVARVLAYAGMEEATEYLRGRLALNTPSGATGIARNSVVPSVEQTATGVEGHLDYSEPASGYIAFVDQGTRPHWPPYEPIAYWARRVLRTDDPRVVRAIQRKIARSGTKAQKFVEKTAEEDGPQAQRVFAAAVERKARTL